MIPKSGYRLSDKIMGKRKIGERAHQPMRPAVLGRSRGHE
jgi:hypothetical protein